MTVREADLEAGCSPPFGLTAIPSGASGHFTTDVNIRIDRQCDSRNADDRRELVCHEMGHSIGLDDRALSAVTCMRTGNMIGRRLPDAHDYEVLHNSYNHNDPAGLSPQAASDSKTGSSKGASSAIGSLTSSGLGARSMVAAIAAPARATAASV